jgi:hypothetical protein
MASTKLANLIDPDVIAAFVEYKLPYALKFTNLAPINNELSGRPGSTITIPAWEYAGDANLVAEGEAIQLDHLQQNAHEYKIHKIGKGYAVTDEAILSGLGDPVGQAAQQMTKAIASSIDDEVLTVALSSTLHTVGEAADLSFINTVDDAFSDFDSDGGVIFMNPADAAGLRISATNEWTRGSQLSDNVIVNGAFGEVLGWQIVRTGKLPVGTAIAMKGNDPQTPGLTPLTTYLKRDLLVETDRDIVRKTSYVTGDKLFVVALTDESRILVISDSEDNFDEDGRYSGPIKGGAMVNGHYVPAEHAAGTGFDGYAVTDGSLPEDSHLQPTDGIVPPDFNGIGDPDTPTV